MRKRIKEKTESFFSIFLLRFRKNTLGMAALCIILFLIFIGIFAPVIVNDQPIVMVKDGRFYIPSLFQYPEFLGTDFSSPDFTADFALFPLLRQSPTKTKLTETMLSPSWEHPMGTDDFGMDVFARIVWGTRVSITIGIVAALLTFVIGTAVGSIAGFFGGWVDNVISRFIEIMMCFPTFFLILAVLAFLPPSIYNIMIVIGITEWTGIARLVRGEVLKVKSLDYVKAAKINGLGKFSIIFRHILPNSITPALISATFNVSGAILTESTLSFLGLGIQPPTPSWGAIIQVAQQYVQSDKGWWLAFFPGLAIFITVTAYNLLGQAIRDASDPRLIE